ncbi:HTH_Tnp_Tc3_2 domain-containing protein [Trichonephila clavipes]|nr:HTH_Tnp_Tc3_2 domain-containing protein [Trichonephila clavipes]
MARIVRHNDESVKEGYIRSGGKQVKLFTSALKAFQCNNRIVMAQRKYLDDFLRGRIIERRECGRTQLEVSEELGIAQSVISRLWQRFQDDVTAKRNRRSTASDLSRQLSSATGTTVSRQTVYRRLGHIGLYARRPVRCVPLTATHCRLRLIWSRRACIVDTTTVVLCDVFRRVQLNRLKTPASKLSCKIPPEKITFINICTIKTRREKRDRRVGQRCTLNLSRAETASHKCGVVVRRGTASSGVVHVT